MKVKEVPNTEKSESTTIIREDTRKEGRVICSVSK
jgi:hypothetical protein